MNEKENSFIGLPFASHANLHIRSSRDNVMLCDPYYIESAISNSQAFFSVTWSLDLNYGHTCSEQRIFESN